MILGFSSGAAYRNIPSTSKEIVDTCFHLGCNAMEIYVANLKEVEALKENIDRIKEKLKKFDYVSLHSPCGKLMYQNDEETKTVLGILQKAYKKFNCRCLVVHPHHVNDWSVFENFSFMIAIENMGNDVPYYNVKQLKEVFDKHPDFKMVLDVSHSYKNDPTFELTSDLMESFKDKIMHIHLSGHRIMHEPLFETEQIEIIKNIPKNLPIILESDCQSIKRMKQEYDYVRNNL